MTTRQDVLWIDERSCAHSPSTSYVYPHHANRTIRRHARSAEPIHISILIFWSSPHCSFLFWSTCVDDKRNRLMGRTRIYLIADSITLKTPPAQARGVLSIRSTLPITLI